MYACVNANCIVSALCSTMLIIMFNYSFFWHVRMECFLQVFMYTCLYTGRDFLKLYFVCPFFLEAVGISFRNFKSKLEDSVGFRPLTATALLKN